jgi:hypothetical protein
MFRLLSRSRPVHALVASLAIMVLNYALTSRWAAVAGALHGPKEPVFLVALVATAAVIAWSWRREPGGSRRDPADGPLDRLSWIACAAGMGLLIVSFLIWFPADTWTERPFLDNWPTRFRTTIDGLSLYRSAVAVGWEWSYLGGYHSSSDVTQTLSAVAVPFVALLGNERGFHALHAFMLVALPVLVYRDLRRDEAPPTARLAVGLVGLTVTGWFSYFLVRSGDTNSLAGTFCAVAALTGSHAAAHGRRWGAVVLVWALVLVSYSHAGFLVYTAILLAVESGFYRDWLRARRATVAVATGALAALPLTWESWRYADYFSFNNVALVMPPFALEPFLRKIYYNVEILFLPGRWFNDFSGLATVLLPVLVFVAWKVRTRAGFYAWAALTAIALLRLNTPELGYAFMRPIHLLAVFPAVALAAFLTTYMSRPVIVFVSALVAVYLQYLWIPVPHIATARALDPMLVDRIRTLDGALILFENTFHRDMDSDSTRETEPTPFPAHLEGFLAEATGKRFYGGLWDGWQWSPFRDQLLSGGAFKGQRISDVPHETVKAELRKWGVKHLLVWSDGATRYFGSQAAFAQRWTHGRWTQYEWLDADPRSVVVHPEGAVARRSPATSTSGQVGTETVPGRPADSDASGTLEGLTPLGATVALSRVQANDLVVVKTNAYPAWTAEADGEPVPLTAHHGQLAFLAPKAGSYDVALIYPRRPWLVVGAVFSLLAGTGLALRWTKRSLAEPA